MVRCYAKEEEEDNCLFVCLFLKYLSPFFVVFGVVVVGLLGGRGEEGEWEGAGGSGMRERERQRDRETERQRETQRETETERETETDRQREKRLFVALSVFTVWFQPNPNLLTD